MVSEISWGGRVGRARRVALSGAALAAGLAACGTSASSSPISLPSRPPTGAPPAAGVSYRAPTPWPGALHDARHSGASDAQGPTSAHVLWTRQLGAPVVAAAAVGPDGTIYDSATNGILHAIDPLTGADKWTFDGHGSTDNGEDLSTSALVLADGTIVWPGPGGTLDGLDPEGRMLWQAHLSGTVLSPAQGPGQRIYVADSNGDLEALTASASGVTTDWKTSVGHPKFAFGSPAVGPDGTVYTTEGNDLVAVRDEGHQGVVKWRFAAKAEIEVSPSVAPDGTVVLGTNDLYEYGIRPSGKVAWRVTRKLFSYSTPAATADGLAYFGSNDGSVYAVRASTGKAVGVYDGTSKALSSNGIGVWTAPLVDGHHDVYFGTASGHIFGFGYDGRKLFDLPTGNVVASYPVLTATGTLLIGSDAGRLYALGRG